MSFLLESFGQGFGQGLNKGIQNFYAQKEQISKNKPIARNLFQKQLKRYGADKAYSEEMHRQAEKLIDTYIGEGIDPTDASDLAYVQMVSGFPDPKGKPTTKEKPSESKIQKFLSTPITGLFGAATQIPELASKGSKALQESFAEKKSPRAPKVGDEKLLTKPVTELTVDEIFRLPQERFQNLKPYEQEIVDRKLEESGERESYANVAKGFIPGYAGLENTFREAGLTPEQDLGPQGLATALQTGGEIAKDFALFGAVNGKTVASRAGKAAALFGGEKALSTALNERRAPTIGEVGSAAALGAGAEVIAPLIEPLWNQIKRIPSLFKTVKSAAKEIKIPSVPGKKVAVDAVEKEIIEKAAEQANSKGVDLLKASQGDPASLNALQKEVNTTAKTFQQTAKFNQKELARVREEVAKKLPESPLEKYYAPKKEVISRPETIAKEEARVAPLKAKIKQDERRLRNLQYEVLSNESYLRQAKASGEPANALERLESNIQLSKINHQKTLNEIRNTQFEIKYKKSPATTKEINEQIEKSFKELREGIENPSAKKLDQIRKRVDIDKEAIETAEKLVKRGEIPGPEVFDEYIKIHKEYNKAYGDLIKELREFAKENRKVAGMADKVKNAENLENLVRRMKEGGEAAVVNQVDKRRAMKALEKPSGAFYRNMLRDLRKDVEAFEKSAFRMKNIISEPAEKAASEVAKKAISRPSTTTTESAQLRNLKEVSRDASKATRNPTKENVSKLAKEAGTDVKATENFINGIKEEANRLKPKLEKGTIPEKEISALTNKLINGAKMLKGPLVEGVILGAAQSAIEEMTGKNVPLSLINLGNRVGRGGKGRIGRSFLYSGSAYIASQVHKLIKSGLESFYASQIKEKRNSPEFQKYRNELEEKYSKARANRIVKKAISR